MFKNWFKKATVLKIEPKILDLKSDDILVLSYDFYLTDKQLEMLKKQCEKSPIAKHKVILLEGGGKIGVLRLQRNNS